jgi:hypothetical protein
MKSGTRPHSSQESRATIVVELRQSAWAGTSRAALSGSSRFSGHVVGSVASDGALA